MVLKAALNVRAVRRAFLVSFLLGSLTSIEIADVVTVSVEPSRTTGMAPLPVFFDATGTKLGAGDLRSARFCWDFGDPLSAHPTATGFNVGHVYDKPGIYTVTVTVTDTTGEPVVKRLQVTVNAFAGLTYYVSSSAGDDGNDGRSETQPFKTDRKSVV